VPSFSESVDGISSAVINGRQKIKIKIQEEMDDVDPCFP
jgi:hypothetical protein